MTYVGKPFWISTNKGDQFRPDVAYLASKNRYLVVWRGPVGGSYGTFGKLVESDTEVSKTDLAISSGVPTPSGSNSKVLGHVAVAVNNAQKCALVVWSQGGDGLLTSDIYGRLVEPDGAFLGPPFQINIAADPVGYDAHIRASWNAKTNQFLVVWEGPNDAGWQMPYGAVLDPSGSVMHTVMVGDRNKSENYSLYAVTANPNTGQWLVTFDKFCRIVDFDGTLGGLSTPSPMNNIYAVYDAFAVPAGYIVVSAAFNWPNKVQVWGATLSADGKVFGRLNLLQNTELLRHARAAFIPKSKNWLALVSLHHNVVLPAELWCRQFDLQFADIDGKPYGVIHGRDYEIANGYAAHAVNTSNTEILVVCIRRSIRLTVNNFIRGTIVETQPGLIIVEYENNVPAPGAYVWVNEVFAGVTNKSGWLEFKLKADDKIVAKVLAYTHPSVKAGHDTWGVGWAYHVWLTSVRIGRDGSAPAWNVSDPNQPQVLTVRKTNTLIGFNVVVSMSWSAKQSDLDQIKQFLHGASDHIYNATDGQLYVEHVGFNGYDKAWSEADIRIHSGTGRANKRNNVSMQDSYVQMYRLGQSGRVDSGVYAHELLHYLAFLPDEYEDDTPGEAICTHKLATKSSGPFAPGGSCSSCPMSGTGTRGPWKLCSSLPENPHNTNTHSGSESCWDILYRRYTDSAWAPTYGRWQLVRPTDRQAILPGPTSVPCSGWMTVDNPTTPADSNQPEKLESDSKLHLSPFPSLASSLKNIATAQVENDVTIKVADAEGLPAQADLWLEHDFGVRRLGRTDSKGLIRMPNATTGKTIRATSYIARDGCVFDAKIVVGDVSYSQAMTLRRQHVALAIRVRPTVSPMVLEILVEASGNLTQPPMVTATPHGVRGSTLVPMVFDAQSSCYRGEFINEQGQHGGGVICATVNRGADAETISLSEYQLVKVTGGATLSLQGGDGYAMLALGRHTTADTIAMLTRGTLPHPLSPNTELIGGPYELAATTRFLDGVIRIVPFTVVQDADIEIVRILRWHENEPRWHAIPTFWHRRELYVGGSIDITRGADPRGIYVAVRQPLKESEERGK